MIKFDIDTREIQKAMHDLSEQMKKAQELDKLRAGKLPLKKKPDLIKRPPHYMHPTIDYLEARHVIENLSYHVATACAYLWRCGRKQGIDPLEDLRKAKEHLSFEKVRLNIYGLRPVYAHSYPTLQAPGIQRIVEAFPYNIANALRYLLGCQIPWDLDSAVAYIGYEIDRLDKKAKLEDENLDLWGILAKYSR